MAKTRRTITPRVPGVELARQAFVYGIQGEFITNTKELAAFAGISEQTVWKYTDIWHKERESLIVKDSKIGSGASLSLSDENQALNATDLRLIRLQVDKTMQELQDLPKISKTLLELAEELAKSDDKELALTLLDKYFRTCANEQKLSKLYMDWKNMWDAKVGVDAVNSIQEAAAKAQAVAVARTPIETETELKPAVAGGVFRKSQ
jgi:hypothetical protein